MATYTFEQFNRTFIATFRVNNRCKINIGNVRVSLHDMMKDALEYLKKEIPSEIVFASTRLSVTNQMVHIMGTLLQSIAENWDYEQDEPTVNDMEKLYAEMREEISMWLPSLRKEEGVELLSIEINPFDKELSFVIKAKKTKKIKKINVARKAR